MIQISDDIILKPLSIGSATDIFNTLKRLLEMAFFEMDMNRVQIKVAVNNKKSRAIPEKLGFLNKGIERDGELLVDNKFTNIIVFSKKNLRYKY